MPIMSKLNKRARCSSQVLFSLFNCYVVLSSLVLVVDLVSPVASHTSPSILLPLDARQETPVELSSLSQDYAAPFREATINSYHHSVIHDNLSARNKHEPSQFDTNHKDSLKLKVLSKYTKLGNSNHSRLHATNEATSSSLLHPFYQQHQSSQQQQKSFFLEASEYPLIEASSISSPEQAGHQAINQNHHHHHQSQSRPVGLLDKICIGTSNKLTVQHNKSDHYQNLVERYSNCTYVIGNLEITWLDESSSTSPLDLSFLESIREITGYLLIAYVDVDTIRMPNLQIIRGRDLYYIDEKEQYAIILKENELRQLELPNLREILAGSVGSFNNRNLCHIRKINWDEILNWPTYRTVFTFSGTVPECSCDPSCSTEHCWGDGPEMCQKYSKVTCSANCRDAGGRCFGPSQNECCHSFCAGGCTGPNQNDCLACKNFYDDGSCIQECPLWQRYNPSKFLWEPNPNGKYAFGATCVKECPEHMLRDSGACVRVCPPNKRSVNGECVTCGGPCPKNCQGVELVHSGNINQLINCTVIEGSLTISDDSFRGYTELVTTTTTSSASPTSVATPGATTLAPPTNAANQSVVVHPPMHPSRLEVFKTLREITGYLKIEAKHPDFKNLSYFTNLKTIYGRTDMLHALSITRTSLVSLNLRSLRKVLAGKVFIEENPELCFADTIDWNQIDKNRPRDDITIRNNAEASKCRQRNLQCHEQCARDGCWGPGQDECLSCNNYKVDDYCVINCNHTESLGFLSYEDPSTSSHRICTRCHNECRLGCSGVEARHCHECKNVKDGPYCVSECPSHKYNNDGICEECDKSCADGCTGPSNKLGPGGCNTCAKAIISSTDLTDFDVTCISANETCPDGFYQEYVLASYSQPEGSAFRLSAGRPVCRKCHHRCKKCIGMGTHKSVCECAKYLNGEQCEESCPARDTYAIEEKRTCLRCSPECNGCTGPTEADCISCRVYRIYYDVPSVLNGPTTLMDYSSSLIQEPNAQQANKQQVRFNCTAQCPPDKPHRISGTDMLDPYCSDEPGPDIEGRAEIARKSSSSTYLLFLLIILTGVMFGIYVHSCLSEKDKTRKLTMQMSGIDDVEPLSPSNLKPNLAPLRSIKETELRKGKVLGSGFGGTVYQGLWYPEGQDEPHKGSMPVAIKVLRDNGQSNMHKEFLDEAYIMASVKNSNLVPLLAVCMTPDHLMLVTQLMPLGCLLDYVKKNRPKIGSKNLLEWGKQIACGMAYLEERRMVHRDLALRNVLLQTSHRARISDFGLAKFLEVDQSEYHSGGGRLPIKWLAPECIRERKFTHKSDVWAFGVTIWELVTFGQRPFEEYETRDVPMAIEKGARLQQPSNVTAEVYKVMIACWFYNPDDRPNFKTLVNEFAKFARDPERYLICGTKGIDLEDLFSRPDTHYFDQDDGINCDDYSSGVDSFDDEAELSSPAASSQPPLSAIPDLTPSTHNRINENLFGFELRHQGASESDQVSGHGPSSHLATPILKKMSMFGSRHNSHQDMEQCMMRQTHNTGRRNHQLAPIKTSTSGAMMITDANNNTLMVPNNNNNAANNGCWPGLHAMSTNSLGQRSEQPTDMYDYLLPSPLNVNGHSSSNFCSTSYEEDKTITVSHPIRQPPHSAGLVANVTNEEYFLSRSNYVNETIDETIHHRLSTSNGNIPYSFV